MDDLRENNHENCWKVADIFLIAPEALWLLLQHPLWLGPGSNKVFPYTDVYVWACMCVKTGYPCAFECRTGGLS